jgi:putative aminopeptidase FrvX
MVIRGLLHIASLLLLLTPLPLAAATLDDEMEAYLRVVAVSGREEPAAAFVTQRLAGLPVSRDALGNVVLTLGSGAPRRLVTCPLDEPGYVVSRILEDGYLRLVPSGNALLGTLWDQSHEGQVVVVGGSQGWRAGAVALPSVHLQQAPPPAGEPAPFTIYDAYVDVGAESAAEVAEMGIRLLDPVALARRPVRLPGAPGELVAGPSARAKGACLALIDAARRLGGTPGSGTTVFAWTAGDLLNPAALAHVAGERGPFDEVLQISRAFEWDDQGRPQAIPGPGGLLAAGQLPPALSRVRMAPPPQPGGFGGRPDWGQARVGFLALPGLYPGTPVETVAVDDVRRLADTLVELSGSTAAPSNDLPPLPAPEPLLQSDEHAETSKLLGALIARYGVSGAEGPVREEIRKHLPSWARPVSDAEGNLRVTFGKEDSKEHVLLVAHMDEVGFRVAEVLPDGRLRLQTRGGLLQTAWEAHAALVHGEKGPVPAVFEPRQDWRSAERRNLQGPLTAWMGTTSAQETAALGITAGSTVTMPKGMLRIGRHRVVARSFDDRSGSTALLLALRRIDPARIRKRVTVAWSAQEEVGLVGAEALARDLPDLTRVHPVDTFVSSDSPVETRRFAYAPLGKGMVLRTMDNAYLAPRELIDRYAAFASRHRIPFQYGFTGGASDGVAFLRQGVVMLPFSWPGRYSHSPVETADLRDLEALTRLVTAVIEDSEE